MASNTCEKCGKGTKFGVSRSHSNIGSNRTFKANLQKKRVDGKKKTLCTSCIKTLSKVQ